MEELELERSTWVSTSPSRGGRCDGIRSLRVLRAIQKWLDDKGYEIVSGESVYLPTDTKELDAEGRESIEKSSRSSKRTTT